MSVGVTRRKSRWRITGASVAGVTHRRECKACQDAHFWQTLKGGTIIAAVADGAGSAACSEIGAALAVHAAVAKAAEKLKRPLPPPSEEGEEGGAWYSLLGDSLLAARADVLENAGVLGMAPADLATTLLVAVATPAVLAAVQIGDGAVIGRWGDGQFHAATRPAAREYVNETTFLTSTSCLDHAQYSVQEGVLTGLILLSDGLQRLALKMPEAEPHPAFFTPLLNLVAGASSTAQAESRLKSFLGSPRICDRADDDLTLVLAVNREFS